PDSIVGFGGYLFNRETMNYTVRHRHYSPALGRFLERDPAGYIDGSNLFEYGRGGPLSGLDPLGLSTWGEKVAGAGRWLLVKFTGGASTGELQWGRVKNCQELKNNLFDGKIIVE